jgi:hypothetical protein
VLLGILLAKWTWALLSPASAGVPATTVWKKNEDAERLFGVASASGAAATAPFGNMQLVGVFAHKTQGFAVLQVQGKQLGVGLGEEVMPGVRLVETQSTYVMLERAGVRQRLDMQAAATSAGIVATAPPAPAAAAAPAAPTPVTAAGKGAASQGVPVIVTYDHGRPVIVGPAPTPAPPPPGLPPGFDLGAAQTAMDKLPPEQREVLQRKIEMMRSQH